MLIEECDRMKFANENLNNTIFNPFSFNQSYCKSTLENNSFLKNQIPKNIFEPQNNILNQKIIDEVIINKNILNSSKIGFHNTLITILNSIVMSVMFFCRLMLADIIKYSSINQALFLDSLIKYVNFLIL